MNLYRGCVLVGVAAIPLLIFVVATFQFPRIPFDDIHWKQGYPIVLVNGTWGRLLSVNGMSSELLVDEAIRLWGTAYQDRFISEFNTLIHHVRKRDNIIYSVELGATGRPILEYAFSTRWKYKRMMRRVDWDRSGRESESWKKRDTLEDSLMPWQVAGDVRYFEWTLKNRYAYLGKAHASVLRNKLDSLRSLEHVVSRRWFALQIQRVLSLFNDSHTRIAFQGNRLIANDKTMPCSLVAVQKNIACLVPDGTAFLKPGFPFLRAINGIPVEQLVVAVRKFLPSDDDYLSSDVLNLLQRTDFLMTLVGRQFNGQATLLLHSIHGDTASVALSCSTPREKQTFKLPVEVHILKGAIGHLALQTGMYPGREFKLGIINAMIELKNTRGLIFDIRGNPGGRRDAIPLLMNYFIPPSELPCVANIAVVRSNITERPPASVEILRSRNLWSVDKFDNSASVTSVLSAAVKNFRPVLELSTESFSSYHFMVITKQREAGVYYYNKPVIVLHDSETASAAGVLLAFLKGREGVRLFGCTSNSDSGFAQAFKLPSSGLVYRLSSMASFKPDGTLLDATAPDVAFNLSLSELSRCLNEAHYDPMVEAALALIEESY